MKKIHILKSRFKDIYKNLACENYLLDFSAKNNVGILFLWENNSTVVIGCHQNPFVECNLEYLRENNIKLSRRITGGGAVYHSKGNINFSFIVPNKYKEKTENIIQNALKNCNIQTEKNGRNDLTINGKKFSGNAYYKTNSTYLHHGTILIDMDFNEIGKILTPDNSKLAKNSVKSVSSRIINLKEVDSKINKEKIYNAIKNEFIKTFSNTTHSKEKITINYQTQHKKFKSKEWLYGKFKDYKIEESIHSTAGKIDLLKNSKNKYIISTDVVDPNLLNKLKNLPENEEIKEEILKILKKFS